LAERAGVDSSPLDWSEPLDPRAELLEHFFDLARGELAGGRGQLARSYIETRGISRQAETPEGLGLVPSVGRMRRALTAMGHTSSEIEESGLLADRRWPGRLCGAWRDEHARVRTLWARSLNGGDPGSKFLYLRGARRTGLPPYGLAEVLSRPLAEHRDLVLVEGLLDVHHFRAHGIPNLVALGGTSINPETFERLARLVVRHLRRQVLRVFALIPHLLTHPGLVRDLGQAADERLTVDILHARRKPSDLAWRSTRLCSRVHGPDAGATGKGGLRRERRKVK
jgi:hypothetical protein